MDRKFTNIRTNLRKNGIFIFDDIHSRNFSRKKKPEICIFCGSDVEITKEHMIPKWVFESSTNESFISGTNKQTQTYNKAVVPACALCNNSVLAPIEKSIIQIFEKIKTREIFTKDDIYITLLDG